MSGTLGLNSSSRYLRVNWLNACASDVILSIDFDSLRNRVTYSIQVLARNCRTPGVNDIPWASTRCMKWSAITEPIW